MLPAVDASNLIVRDEFSPYLSEDDTMPTLDLLSIPAERKSLAMIDLRADLQQAIDTFKTQQVDILYVQSHRRSTGATIVGWVSQDQIDNYYQYK